MKFLVQPLTHTELYKEDLKLLKTQMANILENHHLYIISCIQKNTLGSVKC